MGNVFLPSWARDKYILKKFQKFIIIHWLIENWAQKLDTNFKIQIWRIWNKNKYSFCRELLIEYISQSFELFFSPPIKNSRHTLKYTNLHEIVKEKKFNFLISTTTNKNLQATKS